MTASGKHGKPSSYPKHETCSAWWRRPPLFHMATKTAPINTTVIDERSRKLRENIVKAIKAGNRGHVGSSFSLVEIFRVLYDDILKYDAKNPRWKGRDRCI